MKRLIYYVAAIVAVHLSLTATPISAQGHDIVVVRGPTIVAFFEPVSDKVMKQDADTNEALSDFQLYARQVRGPLRRRGIEFEELYVHSFQVRDGGKLVTFRPGKVKVGYYLIAPGKTPRIEYGVMTDLDLLSLADRYFGISAR